MVLLIRIKLDYILYSGGPPKIRQPYDFLAAVYDYELVVADVGLAITIVLPWLEIVLGVCLVSGLMLRGAFLGCVLLLGLFCVAQVSVLWRGLTIGCGCFGASGPDSDIVSYATFTRTSLLFIAALFAYWNLVHEKREGSVSVPARRPVSNRC